MTNVLGFGGLTIALLLFALGLSYWNDQDELNRCPHCGSRDVLLNSDASLCRHCGRPW